MTTTFFDPKKHLTGGDQKRLSEVAHQNGVNEGDFIEAALKAAIWSFASTRPAPKKKGARK